jgi:GntR family transcriptional regulator, transcriptional repressor for pyruvate dehydrogenase complex
LRFALEGKATALAARRRAPLDAVRRTVDALEKSMSGRSLGQAEDVAFHLAIAAASQNPYFERALHSIRQPLEFSINLTRDPVSDPS